MDIYNAFSIKVIKSNKLFVVLSLCQCILLGFKPCTLEICSRMQAAVHLLIPLKHNCWGEGEKHLAYKMIEEGEHDENLCKDLPEKMCYFYLFRIQRGCIQGL